MRLIITILAFNLLLSSILCQIVDEKERSISTSITGMELLLETERELLLHFKNYITALKAKVKVIQSVIAAMRSENHKSVKDAETFLSNPLNSFALVRRMHTDWTHWIQYLQNPVGEAEIALIQKHSINLPSSTEMDEATTSIHRLEKMYDMKPVEMAAGLLNGKQYNASLSSRDCFEIGQRLLNEDNFLHSTYWAFAAITHYQENDEVNTIMEYDRLKILHLYSEIYFKQHRYSLALDFVKMVLKDSPNNEKFLRSKSLIEHNIKTSKEKPKELLVYAPNLYERSCRGEFDNRLSRLHCRYNTTTHPFLKLAPIKMEELQMDPYIVLFHDVISDEEIDEIKQMARPQLERGIVFDRSKNKYITLKTRTSKSIFFGNNTSNIIKRINQRITDMSGFDMSCADHLLVMNYGLGGHYAPHYDFYNFTKGIEEFGDRIATVLFYLSDVEQGGATVFPILQKAVYPRKGTALMWYNKNIRGAGDDRTLHAGCPVIVGSKWVSTKWIHEACQLFRRPCY